MPAAAVMAMASSVKQLFAKRLVEAFLGKEEAEAGMSRWRNWDAGGSSGTMPRTSGRSPAGDTFGIGAQGQD